MERTFCKAQIQRLAALDFFPTFQPAVTELIDSLADCTQDQEHARLVIDACCRQHGCPEPADIRRVALAIRPPAWDGCRRCNGLGFLHEERIIDGVPYDYSRRCVCHPPRRAA